MYVTSPSHTTEMHHERAQMGENEIKTSEYKL